MGALLDFGHTVLAMLRDITPIAAILIGFQLLVLRRPIPRPGRVAAGLVFVLLGLALFLQGLQLALFPLGRLMAEQLTNPAFIADTGGVPHWLDYFWVYVFAGAIGFSTAIAEPALMAVAIKAHQVSAATITTQGLRVAVALGAGFGVMLGVVRIVTGTPLHWYIIAAYIIVIVQTTVAPRQIIPLAYDSGGVTTSTVTVPLVVALGLGLAESIPGRSALLDGFGMIALTCLFPIMAVMAYAQIGERLNRRARAGEEPVQD